MSDEELRTQVLLINQRLDQIVKDLDIISKDHENRIRVMENRIWMTIGASCVLSLVLPIIMQSLQKG